MKATFHPRNFSIPTEITANVEFEVERYSKIARGGCKEARIRARGDAAEIWRLLDWGRCRVEITNDEGVRVWWGYVRAVELVDQFVTARVDVNEMSNRVAVAYTLTAVGQENTGSRGTTAWAENEISITEFGRKELLESQGGISVAAATAKRDRILADRAYPVGYVQVEPWRAANNGKVEAVITCEGWWWTLDWPYCNVPTQLVAAFETIGTLDQTIGRDYVDDSLDAVRLLQSFSTGATAWNVLQVGIYGRRVGVPAGNLSISLVNLDGSGEPGATVASGTVGAADFGTDNAWLLVTLSGTAALSAGTNYGLQIAFSSALEAANYYVFPLDAGQGYAGGVLKRYVAAWAAVSADLPFRLKTDALVESDVQILNIATAYGQFFSRVAVDGTTGITLESFRSGDNDALVEIEELMDFGDASGARLLAEVDHMRQVRVFPMPDEDAAEVYLRRDGLFYHRNQAKIDPSTCPVGFWARLSSVVPPGADVSRISGLGAFFVEESVYDVASGRLTYTPLGAENIWNLGTKAG